MNTPEGKTRFVRLLFVTICLILSVVTPHYAQKPFAIQDKRLLFESAPDPCQTNAEIRAHEGGYQTTGLVERRGGKFWLWCNGARHTWIGRSTDIEGVIAVIDSDTGDPLQFKVDRSEGYVYVKGKGRISMPNGQVIILPEVPTSGTASEEGRREPHPAPNKQRTLPANAYRADTSSGSVEDDDQIHLRAYLWPFESLCNMPEPAEHVKQGRVDGSIGMKGCRNLDQEWGKPTAVRINLLNPGTSEAKFVIKDLASILLKKSTGGTVAALGFQLRMPDPVVGSTVGIVNKFEGSITIPVLPGQGLDLILLFKDAVAGDSIIIGENRPVQIKKEKSQSTSQPEVDKKPTPASYVKQNPPAPSNSPAVASADRVTPSAELRGVVKDISVHITEIRIDSNGNPVGAKPDVFLVIEGEGGIESKVRWTEATTLFDAKGKRVKKVTIGKNFKEGDNVSIKTRLEKGELQAVEVHKQ